MSGVKGRSGGSRPGAGRKRQSTVEMQGNRRDALLDVVTETLWRETVTGWIAAARASNNYALLFPLLPYILGGAKQELSITAQVEHVQLDQAQRLLRVIGGTERSA